MMAYLHLVQRNGVDVLFWDVDLANLAVKQIS